MISITCILDVEKYLNNIDVVIFDLDDTLYSEIDYVKSGFKEIAKCYPQIFGLYDKLYDAFKRGFKPIDYVVEKLDLIYEKDNWLNIYRTHIPTISLYDGVGEMLARLSKNKKIAIITDGRPEGQRNKICALKLNEKVDDIIITDELGGISFRKPCTRAFEILKAKYNSEYSKMVYIGDNYTKDFIAPRKLGMQSIFFNNKEGLYINEKDISYSTTS